MASTYEWDTIGASVMDSRHLIAVADEIREAIEEDDADERSLLIDALGVDEDEAREILAEIDELAAAGIEDWEYGEMLIEETHFPVYAEELAEEVGAIDREASWPLTHIDWDAAADALKQDYTEVRFRGMTYLVRA